MATKEFPTRARQIPKKDRSKATANLRMEQRRKQKNQKNDTSVKKLHVSSQIQQAYRHELQQERRQIEKLVEA